MDIINKINKTMNDLQVLYSDISPLMPGIAAIIAQNIDMNFAENGRINQSAVNSGSQDLFELAGDDRWEALKDSTKSAYKRKGYELNPTLVRTEHLRNQTEVSVQGTSIKIVSNSTHGAAHQFGSDHTTHPKVTPKMRKFFWAKFYETDDEMWKWLALTKKQQLDIDVHIPARPFITIHQDTLENINEYLAEFLSYAK